MNTNSNFVPGGAAGGTGTYYDPYQDQQQQQQQQSYYPGAGGYSGAGAGADAYQYGGDSLEYPGGSGGAEGYAGQFPDESFAAENPATTEWVDGQYIPTTPVPLMEPTAPAPVTAMALDEGLDIAYVASAATNQYWSSSMRRRLATGAASGIATHQWSTGVLYASVAGHEQAPNNVLRQVYQAFYGQTPGSSHLPANAGLRGRAGHPPPHAHVPAIGTGELGAGNTAWSSGGPPQYHWGISSLHAVSPGYVASVSPSGVGLHTHGGMRVSYLNRSGEESVGGWLASTAQTSNGDATTHLTVGGLADGEGKHVQCLDMYQGLRTVASYRLTRSSPTSAVTCMATNTSKNSIIVGTSDGGIRMLDGSLREWQSIPSSPHAGGVTSIATVDYWIATVGWGGRPNSASPAGRLYALSDPTVYVYDIRYLSQRQRGIPHPFAGTGGGPRWVNFLPPTKEIPERRLLVTSGGECAQIITPMQPEAPMDNTNFIFPNLERNETISSVLVQDEFLALGTSRGKVWPFQVAGTPEPNKTSISTSALHPSMGGRLFVPSQQQSQPSGLTASVPSGKQRAPVNIPSFATPLPAVSLEASILLSDNPAVRPGNSERLKALNLYTLTQDRPVVSSIVVTDHQRANQTNFGHLVSQPVRRQAKLGVSASLLAKHQQHVVDFVQTIPTSDLNVDLRGNHRTTKGNKGTTSSSNPNKLLYTKKLHDLVYTESLNRFRKSRRRRAVTPDEDTRTGLTVPSRYRLTLRPSNAFAASYNHAEYNQSVLLPGWDYPPTRPNAFVAPILCLLYCWPDQVKDTLLNLQFADRSMAIAKEKDLAPEVAFCFHRIESLAALALMSDSPDGPTESTKTSARLGAWAPLNFLSILQAMPEAEALQILDGAAAAVDSLRRAEAFYRFLLYQLDKELTGSQSSSAKLLDSLGGITFASINQFVSDSGASSTSVNRALTVELKYERFLRRGETKDYTQNHPYFCDLLQYNLCSETRLRAWNQRSQSYETIVQRKIAATLPEVLSLSCACAGRKEEEGLFLWRGGSNTEGHWLPEYIEVELTESGNVVVRELIVNEQDGSERWHECAGSSPIPKSVSDTLSEMTPTSLVRKRRYRLDQVLSVIRDDLDAGCPEEVEGLMSDGDESFGHHVLHTRIRPVRKGHIAKQQAEALKTVLESKEVDDFGSTILGLTTTKDMLEKRRSSAEDFLSTGSTSTDEWLLFNGYIVSKSYVEDARAFHVKFKEPSLVVFVEENLSTKIRETASPPVPADVIRTQSMTNAAKSSYVLNQKSSLIPNEGDLVAFDAEFVSVQEEEYTLTETGSKITIRETRHALARISAIDCRTGEILFDDHVLPREPVVDYLTRFSGIVENDLNPKTSPHHLISTRAAYFKLRHLIERGCIFVGHGLQQDFWTVNLAVPASQVIDTVFIFHKPAQRFVSLRFLTNFVLKRDMQLEVHNSVEDAVAAWDLFRASKQLKETGKFLALLDELYEHGQKVDWKLGMP